jgi:hypothetical protein
MLIHLIESLKKGERDSKKKSLIRPVSKKKFQALVREGNTKILGKN